MALLAGCSKELNTEQNGVIAMNGFYKGDEACEMAVTACYHEFTTQSEFFFGASGKFLDNILSDDMLNGGTSRDDMLDNRELNEYQFDYTNSTLKYVFQYQYRMIYRANLVINNYENGTTDIQKRAVAEAKVFRAMSNFNLVTFWKTAPLVLEAIRDNNKAPNSTEAALWEQIESDLTDAINSGKLAKKASKDDRNTTRITTQFAQALLGKSYVFQGKWAEAEKILDEVRGTGLYGYLDDYGKWAEATSNNNQEVIFSDNLANDPNNTVGANWATQSVNTNVLENHMALDYSMMSFGLYGPSKGLIETFLTNEPDSKRFRTTFKSYDDFLASGIKLKDGMEYYANVGYFHWKYRASRASNTTGEFMAFWTNNVYMKYSEVTLLDAEAKLMQGKSADDLINEIRDVAGVSHISGATMEDLKLEKRLQLVHDGCRWRDLVRWGDAPVALAEQGKEIPSFLGLNSDGTYNVVPNRYTNANYGFKDRHKVLPFPETEMNVNPNIDQNEGWK